MGTKIYFLGGYKGENDNTLSDINDVESFDLETETWKEEYTTVDPLLPADTRVGKIALFKEKVLVAKQ